MGNACVLGVEIIRTDNYICVTQDDVHTMNELIMTQTLEQPASESDSSPEGGETKERVGPTGGSEKRRGRGKQRPFIDRKYFRKRILSAPFICKSRSDSGSLGRNIRSSNPEPV